MLSLLPLTVSISLYTRVLPILYDHKILLLSWQRLKLFVNISWGRLRHQSNKLNGCVIIMKRIQIPVYCIEVCLPSRENLLS